MIDDIVKTKMTTISSSNSLNLVEVEEREQEEQQLQETSLTPTTVNVEVTEIPTLENYLTANNIIEENDDEHSTKVARVEDIHYSKISAVTGITLSSSELKSHVLTIEILSSPTSTILSVSQDIGTDLDKDNNNNNNNNKSVQDNKIIKSDKSVDSCAIPEVVAQSLPLSDNSVEFVEMVLQKSASPNSTTNNAASTKTENSAFLYYMMTSGQYSSDMDSGTCSDIEIITPPPLPKKMSSKSKAISLSSTLVANADNTNHTDTDNNNHNDDDYNINLKHMMITNSSHNRAVSFTDSESSSSESSLSCDSLSSQEQNTIINDTIVRSPISFLPDSLLKDIRECKLKLANSDSNNKFVNNNDNEYVPQSFLNQLNKVSFNIMKDCDTNNDICYETDKYYKFHLNEHITDDINLKTLSNSSASSITENDESFAGYKDIHSGTSTIRSSKGTIRGVKNRVRNGIATFLQMQCNLSSKVSEFNTFQLTSLTCSSHELSLIYKIVHRTTVCTIIYVYMYIHY